MVSGKSQKKKLRIPEPVSGIELQCSKKTMKDLFNSFVNRNKEKELDDAEEIRQKDIAVYKQQIKCLLHEHQTTLAESRV
jgi:hypothetical protein